MMMVTGGGASGSSTPREATSPPPQAAGGTGATAAPSGVGGGASSGESSGPSPLTVGTRFVKQYYKVLSTTPEQIHRFYQPSISILSHGVGSRPTQPTVLDRATTESGSPLNNRFALEGYEDCPIRFEFEHGAIDAQLSANGGVLLVVTGHIVYLVDLDSNHQRPQRKAFVHTFFLGSISPPGAKRSYYVHNDILRFLADPPPDEEDVLAPAADAEAVAETEVVAETPSTALLQSVEPLPPPVEVVPVTEVEKDIAPEPMAPEPPVEEVSPPQPQPQPVETEAPGYGVEESKEALMDDEEEVDEQVEDEPQQEEEVLVETDAVVPEKSEPVAAKNGSLENGAPVVTPGPVPVEDKGIDQIGLEPLKPKASEKQQLASLASGPPPKSKSTAQSTWASLVAGGGGSAPATPTPGTPARPGSTATSKPSPTAKPGPPGPTAAQSSSVASADASSTSGALGPAADAGAAAQPSAPPPAGAQPPSSVALGGPAPPASGGGPKPIKAPGSGPVGEYGGGGRGPMRSKKNDPDCTIVIKNIDMSTTETEVLELFETFASQTDAKIVGCTVSPHRNIAFVDYDSPSPVLAAVEQHRNEALQIRGRPLDVYQKATEPRNRRGMGGRGPYRGGGGGPPGNGGYRGGGRDGGGRQSYRRNMSGRGGRDGGRGGGRGGR